jgi:hypothetical protein
MEKSSWKKKLIIGSIATTLAVGVGSLVFVCKLSKEIDTEFDSIITHEHNIKEATKIVHYFKELENPDPTIRYINNARLCDIMETHVYPLTYARDLLQRAIPQLTQTCEKLQQLKFSFLHCGHQEYITVHNLRIKAQNLLKTILASKDYAQELYMQKYPATF